MRLDCPKCKYHFVDVFTHNLKKMGIDANKYPGKQALEVKCPKCRARLGFLAPKNKKINKK